MNINGTTNLRFNKVGTKIYWNASLSTQNQDGTTTWLSVPVTLSKEVDAQVKEVFKNTKFTTKDKYVKINVTKGFLSGYKDKENKSVIKLVITGVSFDTDKKKPTDDVEVPF